jgi:hypothetical protein
MEHSQAGEYTYSIERGFAGAGRRVWRWVIRRSDTGAAMRQGASIRSRDDAQTAALAVIKHLQQPGTEFPPRAPLPAGVVGTSNRRL